MDDTSDLSTFRWDLADPHTSVVTSAAEKLDSGRPTVLSHTINTRTVEEGSETSENIGVPASSGRMLEDVPLQKKTLSSFQLPPLSKAYERSHSDFGHTRITTTGFVNPLGRSIPQKTLPTGLDESSVLSVMPPTLEQPITRQAPINKAPKPVRGGLSSRGHGSHRPSLLRNSSIADGESSKFSVTVAPPPHPKTQPRISQLDQNNSDSTSPLGGELGYTPGRQGGGGRYINEYGIEIPVGGTVKGGPNYIRPTSPASSISTIPRRGGPPKSFHSASGTPSQNLSIPPMKRERPFKNVQDRDTTIPLSKKRGRPFNTAEAAAAAAESTSSDLSQKKRGRHAKAPSDLVFLPPPEPVFHPFLCEWKSCPAELHNLDTLKNHLFKVHSKKLSSGRYSCLWADCGLPRKTIDVVTQVPKVVVINYQFKTRMELHNHFYQVHLMPFAWHMGDGCRGTSLGRSYIVWESVIFEDC